MVPLLRGSLSKIGGYRQASDGGRTIRSGSIPPDRREDGGTFSSCLSNRKGQVKPAGRLEPKESETLYYGVRELRTLHFFRPFHLAGEIIRDNLLSNRLLHGIAKRVPRFPPTEVLEHHHARQDFGSRVHLVHPRILRGRPVDRLEESMDIPDVPARGDAKPADLRRSGVAEVVPVQVRRRKDVVVLRAGEELLEHVVRDDVLDHDFARGRLSAVGPVHLGLRERLLRELLAGDLVPPLAERALRVLHDVPLVDEGDAPAVILDRVSDCLADESFRLELRDWLQTDSRIVRNLHAEVLRENPDEPLRLLRAPLPLDSRIDVLRRLAEDYDVHPLGVHHRTWHSGNPVHRARVRVEVEGLAEGNVQGAESPANRRREWPLQSDDVLPNH